MNKQQTASFAQGKSLVKTALDDLDNGDRIDALDALRMAQRHLRASLGAGAHYLPPVKVVARDSQLPTSLRVTFETVPSRQQMDMVLYALNQLVRLP
jgi:hypothetical protein